ncbi:MAG TPA: ATP-binding cassette domain-containing protein, partial [Burkholderiales bacterium]|nr:ATP-binding cassette domain-containing protein [Burkholderiales bacterium]
MVTLENVSKQYGLRVALAPVSMKIAQAQTTALIGPSGCGKSTLLRMIVGLVQPDTGRVVIGDEVLGTQNVNRLRHAIGYVIQDGGLFPHL